MTDSKITEAMVEAAKAAYWHEVHHGGGYSDKCYEAAISAALAVPTLNITKEWFEKRSAAERDMEVGAGFSIVNPSAADIATMERLLLESLPKWAQTEIKAYRALSIPSKDLQHTEGDEFRGDTPHLIRCIEALLALDAKDALVPHGVGGHARTMLSAAAVRLAALSPLKVEGPSVKAEAFDKIVAARKKHIDAVAAYNARRELANAERMRGSWAIKLDAEYHAMSDAQAEYHRTVQDACDAALRSTLVEHDETAERETAPVDHLVPPVVTGKMEIDPDVTAADLGVNAEPAPMETCERCQGNGEIVTDWERYRHPHEGDKGDEAVAQCPDCGGEGAHPMTDLRNPPLETSDLKPCPFCGERLCLSEFLSTRSVKYFIHEPNGCLIQSTTVPVSERDSSRVENWNRRALPLPLEGQTGWRPIETVNPIDGLIVLGWGEYRERDGFSPAFMRWYDSVKGWSVNAMPFYPTHWRPLPAAPSRTSGGGE